MTEHRSALLGSALICGLGLLVAACPGSSNDQCPPGDVCVPTDSLDAAASDSNIYAPVADQCLDSPAAASCLDETSALFVSNSNGNDQDPVAGSRKSPFKTINAALAKIDAKHTRIYVCEGTYLEDLSLNATHSNLSFIGGFDCAWNPAPATRAVIGASANPLKTDGTEALALINLEVVAKDATTGSSIAAFVNGGDATFRRVKLTAGKGAKGDPGTRADFSLPTDLTGHDGASGGAEKVVTCPDGTPTTGGKGGATGFDGETGTPGADNKGTIAACSGSGSIGGGNGAAGASPPAASGASKIGELSSAGWFPEPGKNGDSGQPGQGGGGGAGLGGGTGGSGGAGGCGGAGGGGGKGGGASIAIAAFQANIKISESLLQTDNAGGGGAGAIGQQGTAAGGPGGTRTAATTACNGGTGGAGGSGAAGGGGAGGISVGILARASIKTVDASTTATIAVGRKGAPGGDAGQKPGVDGVAQAILDLN